MNRAELEASPEIYTAPPEPAGESQPRLLFVPVDASLACRRALTLAIRLAERSTAEIVLAGVVPGSRSAAEMDPEDVRALPAPVDPGSGAPGGVRSLDDEDQVARALWNVLLPLQRHVRGFGVPATVRLLRGSDPAARLVEGIAVAPRDSALVLNNPLTLSGPLRDATAKLLVHPPCTLYVTGLPRANGPSRPRIMSQVARMLWHRHAR